MSENHTPSTIVCLPTTESVPIPELVTSQEGLEAFRNVFDLGKNLVTMDQPITERYQKELTQAMMAVRRLSIHLQGVVTSAPTPEYPTVATPVMSGMMPNERSVFKRNVYTGVFVPHDDYRTTCAAMVISAAAVVLEKSFGYFRLEGLYWQPDDDYLYVAHARTPLDGFLFAGVSAWRTSWVGTFHNSSIDLITQKARLILEHYASMVQSYVGADWEIFPTLDQLRAQKSEPAL